MDLSDEQKRIDSHAYVVAQFDGDYSQAVAYLSALAVLNRTARNTLYSQRFGFIDVHLSGDNNGHTAL